jgi:anti-sigma regulatory factor (Ser/Thr protein kinase)
MSTAAEAAPRAGIVELFIRMNPPWVFIDEIRRFVESFCSCASIGADREAQVALAVHELMQNAVPHANGHEVELDLELDPVAGHIVVRVTNASGDEEYAALVARIEAMYREPDALRSYLRTMKEHPTTARGGLGLARVRFEAQMDIRVHRTAGGRITVEAEGPIRAPSLATVGVSHV